MEDIISMTLVQLGGQIPVFLAYVAGMILALVFWRRCPGPAACTLIATVILLVTSVSQTFLNNYLFRIRLEQAWDNEQFGRMMSLIGIAGSIVRALATGLLLLAVFMGRSSPPRIRPESQATTYER